MDIHGQNYSNNNNNSCSIIPILYSGLDYSTSLFIQQTRRFSIIASKLISRSIYYTLFITLQFSHPLKRNVNILHVQNRRINFSKIVLPIIFFFSYLVASILRLYLRVVYEWERRDFSVQLTRRLAIVAEAWYQESLGIDDDDWFGAYSVYAVQSCQFLWFRVVEVSWYSDVTKVNLLTIIRF